ncbi:MAG: TrbC/VirB2 family protein [Clostridia bacterium]|nr:TrbC/VirB2 family protein [Clostridia bacterium]
MKMYIIIGLILIIMSIVFCNCSVYGFSVSNMVGKNTVETTNIENFGQGIIKVISTVGSICSVAMLIVLGIKYMLGSVEEKAEYKKTLLPYVIGASIVFAASTIASIIYNIAKDL